MHFTLVKRKKLAYVYGYCAYCRILMNTDAVVPAGIQGPAHADCFSYERAVGMQRVQRNLVLSLIASKPVPIGVKKRDVNFNTAK